MRICVINEFFYPDSTGGTGTVLSDLARVMKDRYADVDIDVITSTNLYRKTVDSLPKVEDWDGISIYRVPSPHPNVQSIAERVKANIAFTFTALRKLFQLGKYDLIVIGTAPPMIAFAATFYKMKTATPFVYIVYDLEPDRSINMRVFSKTNIAVRLFRAFQQSWLNAASRIVVLGRCMRDFVSAAYSLPADKIDFIPIGANDYDIVPRNRQSGFRRKHEISGFVVLYTGNFGRYHNFDTVLDAAKQLRQNNAEIKFVLVGGGIQEAHIVSRIKNEKIDNVSVYDFVSSKEYSDLLSTADVSLVTLEPGMEGLCVPSKLYSILASGRPVIGMVSPKSEVSLVIDDAKCGRQIEQGDTSTLVEEILWMASHPEERLTMGNNARKALVNDYGTTIIAEKYYQTFLKATARQPYIYKREDASRLFRHRTTEDDLSSTAEPLTVEIP